MVGVTWVLVEVPCIYCKARKEHLLRTNLARDAFGGLLMRAIQEMTQKSHELLDYNYVCLALGEFRYHSIVII
jgi:hypothetical protein